MSKDHRETVTELTQNLKTLSDTMSSAFTLLQQTLMQRPSPMMPPYYNQQYAYAPPPSPGGPGPSHYHHALPRSTPARGTTQDDLADYNKYSQQLL